MKSYFQALWNKDAIAALCVSFHIHYYEYSVTKCDNHFNEVLEKWPDNFKAYSIQFLNGNYNNAVHLTQPPMFSRTCTSYTGIIPPLACHNKQGKSSNDWISIGLTVYQMSYQIWGCRPHYVFVDHFNWGSSLRFWAYKMIPFKYYL